MSVWLWILLGIAGVFATSLAVGLLVAAILSNIGRAFAELTELEPFEWAQLTQPPEETSEVAERTLVGGRAGRGQLR